MGIEKTLNEMEQEMVSYLLNVDDMNYTMLCEPVFFENKSKIGMTELDLQRASYLLNVDDMNYIMLCELWLPDINRHGPGYIRYRGNCKNKSVEGLKSKEECLGTMELIETSQIEFPKRKFRPLRPATFGR